MTEIIPAIMPRSLKDLEDHMKEVVDLVEMVQVDAMDGVYTPSRSWPYPDEPEFEEMVEGVRDFPELDRVEFSADLMVANPEREAERWTRAGARRILIHLASTDRVEDAIRAAREASVPEDSPLAVECGLAIGIEDDIERVGELVPLVDCVQCMGIRRIGYQGEEFDEEIFSTIRTLRERFPELIIGVDGGVKLENAPQLIEAGANRLAVGSAIFGSDDVPATLQEFEKLT